MLLRGMPSSVWWRVAAMMRRTHQPQTSEARIELEALYAVSGRLVPRSSCLLFAEC